MQQERDGAFGHPGAHLHPGHCLRRRPVHLAPARARQPRRQRHLHPVRHGGRDKNWTRCHRHPVQLDIAVRRHRGRRQEFANQVSCS